MKEASTRRINIACCSICFLNTHGEGKGDDSQRQLIKYFHKKKQQSPPILYIELKYYLREWS